jgi:Contractile injection system tube protein
VAALRILALEGQHQGELLEAPFNPKEIHLDRAIVWQRQPKKAPTDLEFEQADAAHMAFELLFDGVQSSASIQPQLDKLQRLANVDAVLHRPPKVEVSWGNAADGLPKFDGVIESISVRYVQFAPSGVPVRATAAVKLVQAVHLSA